MPADTIVSSAYSGTQATPLEKEWTTHTADPQPPTRPSAFFTLLVGMIGRSTGVANRLPTCCWVVEHGLTEPVPMLVAICANHETCSFFSLSWDVRCRRVVKAWPSPFVGPGGLTRDRHLPEKVVRAHIRSLTTLVVRSCPRPASADRLCGFHSDHSALRCCSLSTYSTVDRTRPI